MDNTFDYIFRITANAEKVTVGMNALNASVQRIEASTVKMDKSFRASFDKINKGIATIKLDAIMNQIERTADGLDAMNAPGLKLSTSMHDLQAMTGVAGAKLKEIEGYARESAKTFGGSAADGVESYKLILGQLDPAIAKVPTALKSMGESVKTTSKLMGNDTIAATEVLTTALNQYQVSTEDPIQASREMARMMNVMAAAAGEGSAELPQIKQALELAGMAAKTANVSFEETNAAIQILDKAGKKGSEGGVALRNTLATLSEGRFLPKDVQKELAAAGVNINTLADRSLSLADRLTPLRGIMNDQALVAKLFGKENQSAAIALISGIDTQRELTKAISGTNTAYEQAAIIMESQEEKNARLKAKVDDFKISLFNGTNGLIGYASAIGDVARDVNNLIPMLSGGYNAIKWLTTGSVVAEGAVKGVSGATKIWTGIQAVFNAVMALNPVILITAAVVALIGVIAWVASATEGWGAAWTHTVNGAKLLFQAYVEGVKFYFATMVNGIMLGINMIMAGWYKFKIAVGIGDKGENQQMLAKIHADTEARKKAIVDGAKKVKNLADHAAVEFTLAKNSVKWKKTAEATDGIAAPKVPGTATTDTTGGATGNEGKTSTNTAIATGGTKHNYITISLENLIGAMTIYANGGKDGAQKAGDATQDELLRLLAMATTAGD